MNRLQGIIHAVETSGHLALVEVAVQQQIYTAMIVTVADGADFLVVGKRVTLLFKETEVSLAKNLSGQISLRNRIPATVQSIEQGELLSAVTLDYGGHKIVAVITTRSVQRLDLAPGDAVEGLVKANELTVVSPEHAV